MFTVISLMLLGIAAGWILRRRRMGFVRPLVTCLIWLLLFLLGVEVGGNERIIRGLHTLGLEALLVAVAATLGSALAAQALWKDIVRRKQRKEAEG